MTVWFNAAKPLNMTGGQRDKTAQHDKAVRLVFVILSLSFCFCHSEPAEESEMFRLRST
jgi:hypothetical protein